MDRQTEKIRNAIKARGDYLYYIYKQLEKEGIKNFKLLLGRAVRSWGTARASNMPMLYKPCDFIDRLNQGNPPEIYERSIKHNDESLGLVRMEYCPMLEAWRKSGATTEEIKDLCDIASEGDYGAVGENLSLVFDQRLAYGADCCIMRIVKRV